MTEHEQGTIEVVDRTTQIKIVKLYSELRINIAGFFSCFIGAIASIVFVLQISLINAMTWSNYDWAVLVFGVVALLCGYSAYSFREKLKAVRKEINELT
ncbi:MAG: hypothetical protein FWG55_09545 [Candidatus Bathyarchaeota archaeon]|nr:hypothetical protein [Candidatus Termiticorpusculum sp.]